jgi:hypothetical protein
MGCPSCGAENPPGARFCRGRAPLHATDRVSDARDVAEIVRDAFGTVCHVARFRRHVCHVRLLGDGPGELGVGAAHGQGRRP